MFQPKMKPIRYELIVRPPDVGDDDQELLRLAAPTPFQVFAVGDELVAGAWTDDKNIQERLRITGIRRISYEREGRLDDIVVLMTERLPPLASSATSAPAQSEQPPWHAATSDN